MDALVDVIAGRFARPEPRRAAAAYLAGLLARSPRKNAWTLAEHAGWSTPDAMQRLLRTASWDVDGARDDVRGYVLDALNTPTGVWVLDETGFVKRGGRSAGVATQGAGPRGRAVHCQLGVFLAYASPRGSALVDRALYLPRTWTADRQRCTAAGIPAEVGFATRPQLGIAMLTRAHRAGQLTGWVAAAGAQGQSRALRGWLLRHRVPFVLAVDSHEDAEDAAPDRRSVPTLRTTAWSAAELYRSTPVEGWASWLLVERRPVAGHTVVTRHVCAGPAETPGRDLVRVATLGRASTACLQAAREAAGLGDYQVRDWRAWYAHITLAMLAAAHLAACAAGPSREP